MDLLLNPLTGDLVFDNTGCPVTAASTNDLAQRLTIKLKTNKGEWFLDSSVGVPWIGDNNTFILGYTHNKQFADMELQRQILEEPDVDEITEWKSEVDRSTRTYSLSFIVKSKSISVPITIAV